MNSTNKVLEAPRRLRRCCRTLTSVGMLALSGCSAGTGNTDSVELGVGTTPALPSEIAPAAPPAIGVAPGASVPIGVDPTGAAVNPMPVVGPTPAQEPATPSPAGQVEPEPATPAPAPPQASCDFSPTRVWRLTHTQLENTVRDVFGVTSTSISTLPSESRVNEGTRLRPYANAAQNLQIPGLLLDGYFALGEEVAQGVLARSGEFTRCDVNAPGQSDCLAAGFIPELGLQAWRRPLRDDEVAELKTLHQEIETNTQRTDLAFRAVVQAMVVTPNFLFRTELGATGPGDVALTEYELASALSYTLWDAPPDAELFQLAAAGLLSQELGAQARRLWANTERSAPVLNNFIGQWLGINVLSHAGEDFKDPDAFDGYSAATGEAYLAETHAFVRDVVFGQGDASLRSLLTATHAFTSPDTAWAYGMQGAVDSGMERVELNPTERRGILTQAAFLTANSASHDTAPVARGVFLRETLMCEKVVLPPIPIPPLEEVEFGKETQTEREKLEVHRAPPACSGCHALFDPLGLAMETYDPVGRFRTIDVGKTIDPSGEVPVANQTIAFTDFVDLMDQLAQQPEVYDCFARQYLMYATGAQEQELRRCDLAQVTAAFTGASYSLEALVLATIGAPGFSVKKGIE